MKIGIRIAKPRKWRENFLVNALVNNGVSKNYISEDIDRNVEVLVSNFLSKKELDGLKHLHSLIIPTAGTESVCMEDVRGRGITLYHNPSLTSKGVANYILDNVEKVLGSDTADFIGGATIGLLGFGNVGKEIYEALKHHGCEFEAFTKQTDHSPHVKARRGTRGLSALLSGSDIIINALPLTQETRGLLYERTHQMKKGSLVTSVSRSGIVDDRAVLERVIDGGLFGAILDTYSNDIQLEDYSHERIALTPHIAGIYGDALQNISTFIQESIQDALRR